MSDLVGRLRESTSTCYLEKITASDLCEEAADEIERLQASVEAVRAVMSGKYAVFCMDIDTALDGEVRP